MEPSADIDTEGGSTEPEKTIYRRLLGPSLQKSGLEGVDQDAVSRIIFEASEGTKYFEYQKRKDSELSAKISALITKVNGLKQSDIAISKHGAERRIAKLEKDRDLSQFIVHIDCDAFYASVELLEHPELKDKPFAVGGGVISTCNYVARKYGVRSAMAEFVARKLCPNLIVIPPDYKKYTKISETMREVFHQYDPRFYGTTLDEAYLNITSHCKRDQRTPVDIVEEIRRRVHEATGVTVSAGIAPNSRVAKIASNVNKPNGQYVVRNDREMVMDFIAHLPVRKINGVGYVLERELRSLGIEKCGDIYQHIGILGLVFSPSTNDFLLSVYLGLGSTSVKPSEEHTRKSISSETTFRGTNELASLKHKLQKVCEELSQDCLKLNLSGKKLTLKIKRDDFQLLTRGMSLSRPLYKSMDLYKHGIHLLSQELPITARLIGLRLHDLVEIKRADGPLSSFLLPARPQQSQGEIDVETKGNHEADTDNLCSTSTVVVKNQEVMPDPVSDCNLPNKLPLSTNESFQSDLVECPVCNAKLKSDDTLVNRHVDWCLSRLAIREAVKETYHLPS
ncbi:uncharacterized protein V1510DRAFT_363748 [Dipodascopsis tothii]|uniref:uncharacterized protein n=1 Tax=Dipodascopsis tothii TaxID=44089 RepID=UPI0034D00CED